MITTCNSDVSREQSSLKVCLLQKQCCAQDVPAMKYYNFLLDIHALKPLSYMIRYLKQFFLIIVSQNLLCGDNILITGGPRNWRQLLSAKVPRILKLRIVRERCMAQRYFFQLNFESNSIKSEFWYILQIANKRIRRKKSANNDDHLLC